MKPLNKLIAFLKPFKELIAIVIFLAGVGYAAFTHFATAAQLADARTAIEGKLANQKLATSTSLTELKCLNTYNRDLLRAQIEEIGLSAVLERNLQKSEMLRGDTSEFARVELLSLKVNRDTVVSKLAQVDAAKKTILLALQNGTCSTGI